MILVVPGMATAAVIMAIVADPKLAMVIGLIGLGVLGVMVLPLLSADRCAQISPVLCEQDRAVRVLIGSASASLLLAGGAASVFWRVIGNWAKTVLARILIAGAAIAAACVVFVALY